MVLPMQRKARGKNDEELEFADGAGVAYRDLPRDWRFGLNLYFKFCARLVSDAPEAFVDTALLGVRTGLDHSLCNDGNRRMACLAQAGFGQCQELSGIVCISVSPQCRMVASLFWTAKSVGRFIGHRSLVGGHSGNPHRLLENFPCCRSSPGTVLAMGQLCHGA